MYKTLLDFKDREAEGRGLSYIKGEKYPKKGINVSEDYIAFLLSSNTSLGAPFIEYEAGFQIQNVETLKPIEFENYEELEKPRRKRKTKLVDEV